MRICIISTPIFPCIPPNGTIGYGGLEPIAWQLAKGLAEKGHQVALVAPEGSNCHNVTIIPNKPIRVAQTGQPWDEKLAYGGDGKDFGGYWKFLTEFDCVVDHSWAKWAYVLKQEGVLKAPVLGVLHAPVNTMMQTLPPIDKPCFVCISEDQGAHFRALFSRDCRVAYNGCFEGSTKIQLEGGRTERIDSFVARKGVERLLAWKQDLGEFVYVAASQWLELAPQNPFAVEIKLDDSESTLISTPDNPIMTRRGWIPAYQLSCDDEVLCGESQATSVDKRRGAVCAGALWSNACEGHSSSSKPSGLIGLLSGGSGGQKADASAYTSLLDEGGGRPITAKLPRKNSEAIEVSSLQPFVGRRQGYGSEARSTPNKTSVLPSVLRRKPQPLCLSESTTQETDRHTTIACGLSGRDCRRGRLCYHQPREKAILTKPSVRYRQFGYADYPLCQEVVARNGMGGKPPQQETEDQESKNLLACIDNRSISWQSLRKDPSLHDSQEEEGASGDGVLRACPEEALVGKIQRAGDSIVSANSQSQLSPWKKVVSVRRVPTPARVFDLKTSTGSFVANGIVVHNCDSENFYKPLGLKRSDRFLFLARFSTIKGPDIGQDVCIKCNRELDLVGDTSITGEPEYLEQCKRRSDGKRIRLLGGVTRGECVWWMSQAHALLHCNKSFREPFGLAPVEAQACGCPVIAFNNGACREIIKHGETGFVVDSVDEMVGLVKSDAISTIDRNRCREWALRFSVASMVSRYIELCQEAVSGGGW